ncbi:MAG: glycosyltransferase family 1 protein [Bacteroidota bacterium]|nr:glycosyltransferase family 1 protein [Bacteroidota bacterium]
MSATALRVALFTGNYHYIPDGVALTLNRLVRFLLERRIPVLVFSPTAPRPALEPTGELVPVPSVPVPGRAEYRFSIPFSPRLWRRLRAFGPTLLHVATPDLLGLMALRYGQGHGIPVVASYHTHFASYLKYYRFDGLEQTSWRYFVWFYNQCQHVYVPTPEMERELRAHGVETEIRRWARGVDTDLFHPARRSEAWRRMVGVQDRERVVLFVSRLVQEKNLPTLKAVFQQLHALEPELRFVVIGDGPEREELARALPFVRFLGHQTGEALATGYASSDVFVFPSDTETFGNVTLEAMASGLPAVCADAAGSRFLVRHGQTGFLCPPYEVEAYVERIRLLLRDEPLRRRMGQEARQWAETFAWERVMDELLGHYRDVLQSQTSMVPALEAVASPVANAKSP